jgi:D-threo-aldose 1-dehydrogenase
VADYAYDRGFRYFDTAPAVCAGLGEHASAPRCASGSATTFIVSTKVGRRLHLNARRQLYGWPGRRARYDYSYDGLMRALEDSLQRLGLCRVDIALIHDVNPRWHGDDYERVSARRWRARTRRSSGLRDEGVVRAIGVGVKGADVCLRFARAGRFDCLMLAGGYTLLEHAALDEFLPHCASHGIAVLVASPFNSGILATGAVDGARYFYQPPPAHVTRACSGSTTSAGGMACRSARSRCSSRSRIRRSPRPSAAIAPARRSTRTCAGRRSRFPRRCGTS